MANGKVKKQDNKWTVVWTNPNPTSTFAPNQVVNIDLSSYAEVDVVIKASQNGTMYYHNYLPIPSGLTIVNSVSNVINQRYNFSVDATSINFGIGAGLDTYNSRRDLTDRAIPFEVLAR